MNILVLILIVSTTYFFYEFRRYYKAYKKTRMEAQELINNTQKASQKSVDMIHFYSALFYKLAYKSKFQRKDFQHCVYDAYSNLPVRGQFGEGGYWENLCELHKVTISYKDQKS